MIKNAAGALGVAAIVLLGVYGTLLGSNSLTSRGTNTQSQSTSISDSRSVSTLTETVHHSAMIQSVEDFGPVLTLDQAEKQIGLNFTLPTGFPNGLVLKEIRGRITGQTDPFNQVVLLFTSPSLPKLGSYGGDLSMIISFTKGGVGYYPRGSGGPITYQNVTISGHPGSGWDPQPYSGNAGGLDWQSGGVHCTIVSFLPVSQLVVIAQQLKT